MLHGEKTDVFGDVGHQAGTNELMPKITSLGIWRCDQGQNRRWCAIR